MATSSKAARGQGSLIELLSEHWLEDEANRFLIRGYPTFGYDYDTLEDIFVRHIADIWVPWPDVRFGVAKSEDPPMVQVVARLFSDPSGRPTLSSAAYRFECVSGPRR